MKRILVIAGIGQAMDEVLRTAIHADSDAVLVMVPGKHNIPTEIQSEMVVPIKNTRMDLPVPTIPCKEVSDYRGVIPAKYKSKHQTRR